MRKVRVIDGYTCKLVGIKVGSIVDLYTKEEAKEISPKFAELVSISFEDKGVIGFILDNPEIDDEYFLYIVEEDIEEV